MPNNSLRLGCGRKIIYHPAVRPKNYHETRQYRQGLGVRKECCACKCKGECEFDCKWVDSFGEALGTSIWLLSEPFNLAGRQEWSTENGELVLKFNNQVTGTSSMTSYFFSHLSIGVEVTMGSWIDDSGVTGIGRPSFSLDQFLGDNIFTVFLNNLKSGEVPVGYEWVWGIGTITDTLPSFDVESLKNPQPGAVFAAKLDLLESLDTQNRFYYCVTFNGALVAESEEVRLDKNINYLTSCIGGWDRHTASTPVNPPQNVTIVSFQNVCVSELPADTFCDACDDVDPSYHDATRQPDILFITPRGLSPTDGNCPCENYFLQGFPLYRDDVDPCLWKFTDYWCNYGTDCTVTTEIELRYSAADNGTWDLVFNLVKDGGDTCVKETLTQHCTQTFSSCGFYPTYIEGVSQADDISSICGGVFPQYGWTLNPYDGSDPRFTPAATPVAMSFSPNQPGTAARSLFAKYKCDGRSYVHTMNNNKLSWCEDNVELICSWVERTARLRKVPFNKEEAEAELRRILGELK